MKMRILITILLSLAVILTGYFRFFSFEKSSRQKSRIRFQIAAVEENTSGGRKVLSETTIEGLPGTDFNINLQTERFRMQARFLSDLIAQDKLKIRAKLNTRRLYGQSERQLPLYEEDAQNHSLEMGFEESIVLLPFGRGGGTEILKIEITPTLLILPGNAKPQPLKIEFGKQLASGEISVQASKSPHRFTIEAALLADGQEIARGACDCLLEEAQKIILQPKNKSDNGGMIEQPLTVNFTIDGYTRSRPDDTVAFSFDLLRAVTETGKENNAEFITKGAGVASLGNDLNYSIEQISAQSGKKYELKFNIRLDKDESVE